MKGKILDFAIALIGATAVLVAGLALLCAILAILDTSYPGDLQFQARKPAAPAAPVSCAPDGVAITSLDRLRASVTMLDRMVNTGRSPDGKCSSMAQTAAAADAFAAQQTSPDVTLGQLGRCDETLVSLYPHGYWMLSSALVRESARRRGVTPR